MPTLSAYGSPTVHYLLASNQELKVFFGVCVCVLCVSCVMCRVCVYVCRVSRVSRVCVCVCVCRVCVCVCVCVSVVCVCVCCSVVCVCVGVLCVCVGVGVLCVCVGVVCVCVCVCLCLCVCVCVCVALVVFLLAVPPYALGLYHKSGSFQYCRQGEANKDGGSNLICAACCCIGILERPMQSMEALVMTTLLLRADKVNTAHSVSCRMPQVLIVRITAVHTPSELMFREFQPENNSCSCCNLSSSSK